MNVSFENIKSLPHTVISGITGSVSSCFGRLFCCCRGKKASNDVTTTADAVAQKVVEKKAEAPAATPTKRTVKVVDATGSIAERVKGRHSK